MVMDSEIKRGCNRYDPSHLHKGVTDLLLAPSPRQPLPTAPQKGLTQPAPGSTHWEDHRVCHWTVHLRTQRAPSHTQPSLLSCGPGGSLTPRLISHTALLSNRCCLRILKTAPLSLKEIKPVHPKGNQSWIFIGRTDAEAETLILWLPDVKNWLLTKDLMLGKIEGRRRRG